MGIAVRWHAIFIRCKSFSSSSTTSTVFIAALICHSPAEREQIWRRQWITGHRRQFAGRCRKLRPGGGLVPAARSAESRANRHLPHPLALARQQLGEGHAKSSFFPSSRCPVQFKTVVVYDSYGGLSRARLLMDRLAAQCGSEVAVESSFWYVGLLSHPQWWRQAATEAAEGAW